MKKLPCALSAVCLLAMSASMLAAEESAFYAALGTGRLDFDYSDGTCRDFNGTAIACSSLNMDFDSAIPIRLSGGYNWGGWALELAYEHMLNAANVQIGSFNIDFDYYNVTLGGVYRSSGQLYFLGKFGLSQPHMQSNLPGTTLKTGRTGYAGAGVGYRFKPALSVEFDYTRTNDDTAAFVLGLRRHF